MIESIKRAVLLLEDGSTWEGYIPGAFSLEGALEGTLEGTFGEVVFNTSMCGYEEILTDPSYAGQIVVMTFPHIGNYGITLEDQESSSIHVKGLVVRELTQVPYPPRGKESLMQFMEKNGVPILAGVNTRALVKHLRNYGVMRGRVVVVNSILKKYLEELQSLPDIMSFNWVQEVSTKSIKHYSSGQPRIVVYDFGCKNGILKKLKDLGCEVILVPANTSAFKAMKLNPDGILLSNGPGNPSALISIVSQIKLLIKKNIPILGICLGHQLLALAFGGKTYKLKFGHRGANHPVKDITTGKVLITSHNHGYAVSQEDLPPELKPTFINLYDKTLEGFCHVSHPIMAVQFHPEGNPGPNDALYLFNDWIELVKETANKTASIAATDTDKSKEAVKAKVPVKDKVFINPTMSMESVVHSILLQTYFQYMQEERANIEKYAKTN